MKIYFAADHGGYALKEALKPYVQSLGYEVEDAGAHTLDGEDDYPVFVQAAARKVAEDPEHSRGIVIGGSGQGEAIAANRIKGVRAVVYYGEPARKQTDAEGKSLDMIFSTRDHNNSNVLSLAGRFLTEDEAKKAVSEWLAAPYSRAERHERRHKMIDEKDTFDEWNGVKKITDAEDASHYFREGDIFFTRIGKNIGFEQDGKGRDFMRPVVVVRKFNNEVFFGVMLTTRNNENPFYMSIGKIRGKENFAILSQCRLLDARRLDHKIGHVPRHSFLSLKERIRDALKLQNVTPPLARGVGRRSDI